LKCPGTYSRTSLLSSPSGRSGPPQAGQAGGGAWITASRGRWSGSAPRRLDPGSRSRRPGRGRWRLANRRFAAFQLLQRQLELRDLARQLLRRAAELHPAQPHQLHLQLLDLQRLALQRHERRRHQLLQAVDIVRQGVEIGDHPPRLR